MILDLGMMRGVYNKTWYGGVNLIYKNGRNIKSFNTGNCIRKREVKDERIVILIDISMGTDKLKEIRVTCSQKVRTSSNHRED